MSTPERACGTCGACCKVYEVTEPFQKAAGAWCHNWKRELGCKIYADRPDVCRSYRCAWIKGFGREDERPDATRIVLDSTPTVFDDPEDRVLRMTEVSVGALNGDYARRVTNGSIVNNVCVLHITLNGTRRLILPRSRKVTQEKYDELRAAGIEVFQ